MNTCKHCNKTDLRQYSDGELSSWVMNDEGLYNMRRDRRGLVEMIDEIFLYTDAQLDELNQDLDDEENEENAIDNNDIGDI